VASPRERADFGEEEEIKSYKLEIKNYKLKKRRCIVGRSVAGSAIFNS
jgi:hypothetical protein